MFYFILFYFFFFFWGGGGGAVWAKVLFSYKKYVSQPIHKIGYFTKEAGIFCPFVPIDYSKVAIDSVFMSFSTLYRSYHDG